MAANYADIIFFAVVAIYLGMKLFSVLGKKNEQDTNLEARKAAYGLPQANGEVKTIIIGQPVKQPEPVIKNVLENFKFSSEEAKMGIKEIIEKDTTFSLEHFVEGAKIALEMLFKAFSMGDKVTIKNLVADDIYAGFDSQMNALLAQGHIATKSLVGIEDVEIISANISASRVKIGLRFMTEQISVTKDSAGNIIEGDPKRIENVEDVVEFERNTRAGNPNWTIVSL